MKELLWNLIAKVVSNPRVADYLINRSQRTPYYNLEGYMNRWWLFNGYTKENRKVKPISWLPSIRIHHILRADADRHQHDHPWNARSIILRGYYIEERLATDRAYIRGLGDTSTIRFGEYHTITHVSEGGVYTMFLTWEYMGVWGFWVNGKKVPHNEYESANAE